MLHPANADLTGRAQRYESLSQSSRASGMTVSNAVRVNKPVLDFKATASLPPCAKLA